MAWATISSSGNRKLAFSEKSIDAGAYIEFLENNLLEMEGLKEKLFM
jgi:hypothetical protein